MIGQQDGGHFRRRILGAGCAALAAAMTMPQADAANAADPGPENRGLAGINPDALDPPATDHGGVQSFWHSFSLSHRRIQDGGWARQVNQDDFPRSKDLAGVNMKLNAGVAQHSGLDTEVLAAIPKGNLAIVPKDTA